MVGGSVTGERVGNWSRATATQRIDRTQKALEILSDHRHKESYTIDQAIAAAQVQATLAVAEATLELSDMLERMDV